MWDLVNLKGVCTRTVHLPVLERIGASKCSLLVKLPITTNNAEYLKEIRAKLEWWNHITHGKIMRLNRLFSDDSRHEQPQQHSERKRGLKNQRHHREVGEQS